MKARYFKDESILGAKARAYQSYGWSSLLEGIEVLKKGSRYLVGDGRTIRIGKDNVIEAHPPRPLQTTVPDVNDTIQTLISSVGLYRYWNSEKILATIDPMDQNYLKKIHLSRYELPDRLI